MSRALKPAIAVVTLAVAIFVAGSLGVFGVGGAREAGSSGPVRTGSRLAPASSVGMLDASIASLQESLRRRGDDWRGLARLGLAYLEKARLTIDSSYYSKADSVLRRSLSIERADNFEGALGMGILAGARHEFRTSLEWGRRARSIAPFDPDAHGVIVDALVELGRYRPARRALQEMVDMRPDLASFARVSYYRELHGDSRGAVDAMTRAFEAVGGAGMQASWASYQLGELHLDSGRLDEAAFAYRRAAYLAPDYYLPKVGLARLAAARGDDERAVRILGGVVRSYPAPAYVMELGDLFAAIGRKDRARDQYALVRVQQELFSSNGVAPDVEIVNFYSDHGLKRRWALRTARSMYRERPSVRVADALAWALYANGRYAAAARRSDEALRLGTSDPLFHLHAGMIARALALGGPR